MQDLAARITASLNAEIQPVVADFAAQLAQSHGALAVLFYGSNLRTGSLEGVLDYYVLMDGRQVEKVWPLVSYHEAIVNKESVRAKVATMSLAQFAKAASGQSRDTTIWARFVQPSALIWSRDAKAVADVHDAIAHAAKTAARLAACLGPESGSAQDYWRALFQATYKAEFRVEKSGREDSILAVNEAHFDGLLPLAWAADNIDYSAQDGILTPNIGGTTRHAVKNWWAKRQRLGKLLNITRLLKASTTFEGAGAYAAWKVERHTGVPVKLTPFRENHPVLASPIVLWQVWRAKRKKS